jgi:hypothetical protein
MQPDIYLNKPTPEQISNLGKVIEDYYAYVDRMLGQLLTIYGSDVTIFIISDHGFHPDNLEAPFNPNNPPSNISSASHSDAPPGVFIAASPRIRKSHENLSPKSLKREDLETVGSVLDIAPTILAMLRIPVGKDIDGNVMRQLFLDDFFIDIQLDVIASHDTQEFLDRRPKNVLSPPGKLERLEQLRSLGYIGDTEKKQQPQ